MVEAKVEISVAHLPEGSLYRRIVEQATRENMTPLEVIYLFAKERGGDNIYTWTSRTQLKQGEAK